MERSNNNKRKPNDSVVEIDLSPPKRAKNIPNRSRTQEEFIEYIESLNPCILWKKNNSTKWIMRGNRSSQNIDQNIKYHLSIDEDTFNTYLRYISHNDYQHFGKFYRNLIDDIFINNWEKISQELEREGMDAKMLDKEITKLKRCQKKRQKEEMNIELVGGGFGEYHSQKEEYDENKQKCIEEFIKLIESRNIYDLWKSHCLINCITRRNYGSNSNIILSISHQLNIADTEVIKFVNCITHQNYADFEVFYHNILEKIFMKNSGEIKRSQEEKERVKNISNDKNYENYENLPDDEFLECLDFLNLPDPDN